MRKLLTSSIVVAAGFFATVSANAAPVLSLTVSGGSATSASIVSGTSNYNLDLHLNSDGNPVSGLQYYINEDLGPSVVKYGGNVVSVISPPLAPGDLELPPDSGSTLSAPTGSNYSDTWLFHSGTDYPQINGAIATYTLDTASLIPGIYQFSPVKTVYSFGGNASGLAFNAGSFVLTVTPVPEPSLGFAVGAGLLISSDR